MARRGGKRGRKSRESVATEKFAPYEDVGQPPLFSVFDGGYFPSGDDWFKTEASRGKAYRESVWAYAAIRAVAQSAASVRWQLMRRMPGVTPDEEVADHPLLDLIEIPNPEQCRFEFIEDMIWQLHLDGNAYTELVPFNPMAVSDRRFLPRAMYCLKSKHVDPIPDARTRVSGYKYAPNHKEIRFKPWEIIQIRMYNPDSDSKGYSPFDTARTSVAVDRDSQKYSARFFERGAMPGAVLETDRTLPKPIQNRIEATWKKQFRGVDASGTHDVALLMAGLKYKPVSATFRDMDFKILREQTRGEILAAVDVPPLKVGVTSGSSWANAHQQNLDFITDTVGPHLLRLMDKFNTDLTRRYAGDLYFKPDWVTYLKSPEQEEGNERRARALWKDGLLTRDEARQMAGFGSASDGGEEFIDDLRNTGSTLSARSGNSVVVDGEEQSRSGQQRSPDRARDVEVRPRNRVTTAAADAIRDDHRRLFDTTSTLKESHRADVFSAFSDMFSAQSSMCVEKLLAKDSEGLASISKMDANMVLRHLDTVSDNYVTRLAGHVVLLASTAGESVIQSVLGFESVDLGKMRRLANEVVSDLIQTANKTTAGKIVSVLHGATPVDTQGQAEALVADIFSESVVSNGRMNVAVEAAMTRSVNYGIVHALEANGWIAKTWLCGSGSSRDAHSNAHGQTVRIDEPFSVGGESLMYPGDPAGSAKNTCGCQCIVVPGAPSDLVPVGSNGASTKAGSNGRSSTWL